MALTFEEFEGEKPISSLPYYPLEEHKNRVEIETRLLESGKLFRKYCTAEEGDKMYQYTGEAILDKKGFRGVQADRNVSASNRGLRDPANHTCCRPLQTHTEHLLTILTGKRYLHLRARSIA